MHQPDLTLLNSPTVAADIGHLVREGTRQVRIWSGEAAEACSRRGALITRLSSNQGGVSVGLKRAVGQPTCYLVTANCFSLFDKRMANTAFESLR